MKKNSTGSKIFRIVFSLLFMAIGVWIIIMAIKGETPTQPLETPNAKIVMGVFGAMFCASNIMGIVYALLSGSPNGPAAVAGIATVVCVLFGLCFLTIAILQPGEIVSTTSVNDVVVSESKGHWSGAVVFAMVGVLPIIFARQIYRLYKKHLEKNN